MICLARSDRIFFAEWERLGKVKYSDLNCPLMSSPTVAVKCEGVECGFFAMHKNGLGKLDFVGCGIKGNIVLHP